MDGLTILILKELTQLGDEEAAKLYGEKPSTIKRWREKKAPSGAAYAHFAARNMSNPPTNPPPGGQPTEEEAATPKKRGRKVIGARTAAAPPVEEDPAGNALYVTSEVLMTVVEQINAQFELLHHHVESIEQHLNIEIAPMGGLGTVAASEAVFGSLNNANAAIDGNIPPGGSVFPQPINAGGRGAARPVRVGFVPSVRNAAAKTLGHGDDATRGWNGPKPGTKVDLLGLLTKALTAK